MGYLSLRRRHMIVWMSPVFQQELRLTTLSLYNLKKKGGGSGTLEDSLYIKLKKKAGALGEDSQHMWVKNFGHSCMEQEEKYLNVV